MCITTLPSTMHRTKDSYRGSMIGHFSEALQFNQSFYLTMITKAQTTKEWFLTWFPHHTITWVNFITKKVTEDHCIELGSCGVLVWLPFLWCYWYRLLSFSTLSQLFSCDNTQLASTNR
eukprot:PhF_6_TR41674/c0_g1_i2/m.63192